MVSAGRRAWEPLPREEVVKAVERKRPSRIPLVMAKWWGEGLWERHGEDLRRFDRFPDDVAWCFVSPVEAGRMGLSWDFSAGGGHDSRAIVDDWSRLDEFVEKLTDPENDPDFDAAIAAAERARVDGRYVMFGWWGLFFERPWIIRGMQNLMTDYYLEPENVHRLHSALCDQYLRYIRRGLRDIRPDGFWTSDDLGNQRQLMMSPATFRELIKPYYVRVGAPLRAAGVHWWLHSCGNNTEVLGDLADAGLAVFHPVQKGTMDERAVAAEFGDRLTFLVGVDVQHALQELSPEGVRKEIRYLIDTFDRPGGGMCLAAGNGIVPPTPLENIEAFLEESLVYGTAHRACFA